MASYTSRMCPYLTIENISADRKAGTLERTHSVTSEFYQHSLSGSGASDWILRAC
jgi:hypothetical protein